MSESPTIEYARMLSRGRYAEPAPPSFWQKLSLIFTVFIIALFADAITTVDFMVKVGIEAEMNPFVLQFSRLFGPVIGPFAAAAHKAASAIFLALAYQKHAYKIFSAASVSYLFAACYNMWAFELHASGAVSWLPF